MNGLPRRALPGADGVIELVTPTPEANELIPMIFDPNNLPTVIVKDDKIFMLQGSQYVLVSGYIHK